MTIEQHDDEWELLEVRRSGLHGFGVFALKDIEKGRYLTQYLGEIGEGAASDKRIEAIGEATGSFYHFGLEGDLVLDGFHTYNTAARVNHSCEPNCEIGWFEDHFAYPTIAGRATRCTDNQLWLVASRDIKAGEEVFFNYGTPLDDEVTPWQKCLCGSPSCVGFICAEEDWPKLRKRLPRWKREGLLT